MGRVHFIAPTPRGGLHLDLPAPQGEDAVGAALALAAAEPVLEQLERWLALALDPEPMPPAATLPAGLVWCAAASDAQLGLPWPLLAHAPRDGVPYLQTPELALWMDVARWPTLPARAAARDAGLLLLPASFGAAWLVTLVQPELGFEFDAHWAGPGHAPTRAGAPRALAPPGARVRLSQPLRWPLAAAMGWSAAPAAPPGVEASAFEAGFGEATCHGHVVPALGGAALLVAEGAAALAA